MDWIRPYLNLEFHEKDCNCWTFLCRVLQEQCGIRLPTYQEEYVDTQDRHSIATTLQREIDRVEQCWEQQEKEWVKIEQENLWDIILFRLRGRPLHCGIVLGQGKMLHMQKTKNVVVERYCTPFWQPTIIGCYRYVR